VSGKILAGRFVACKKSFFAAHFFEPLFFAIIIHALLDVPLLLQYTKYTLETHYSISANTIG
jgi:hypothetical protein